MRLRFQAILPLGKKTVIGIPGLFHQLGSDRKADRLGIASGYKPDSVSERVGVSFLGRIEWKGACS